MYSVPIGCNRSVLDLLEYNYKSINLRSSEVCHPRCVFKLYGGVNFSQNNYKYG